MKTITKWLIYSLVACLFMACGDKKMANDDKKMANDDKKITVKGADGTVYESYQECCAANDYEAAHLFLAKMKNAIAEKEPWKIQKAENELAFATDEVFKHEALFLMSQEDEMAKKRILYLLEEMDVSNEQIDMVVDMAIQEDDEDFVKKVANKYKLGRGYIKLEKIIEYLTTHHKENNKDYLLLLLKRAEDYDQYLRIAEIYNDQDAITDIFNIWVNALINESNFPVLTKGLHSVDVSCKGPACNTRISDYNQRCITLLHKAIAYKRQEIAEKIITLMKPNIVTHIGSSGNPKVEGVPVGMGNCYIQYVNNDIDEANRILKQRKR